MKKLMLWVLGFLLTAQVLHAAGLAELQLKHLATQRCDERRLLTLILGAGGAGLWATANGDYATSMVGAVLAATGLAINFLPTNTEAAYTEVTLLPEADPLREQYALVAFRRLADENFRARVIGAGCVAALGVHYAASINDSSRLMYYGILAGLIAFIPSEEETAYEHFKNSHTQADWQPRLNMDTAAVRLAMEWRH